MHRIDPRNSYTIIPIILTSDKTVLGELSGEATAWPVYMTIGNVNGYGRFHPSNRAMRLIGMLPGMSGTSPI